MFRWLSLFILGCLASGMGEIFTDRSAPQANEQGSFLDTLWEQMKMNMDITNYEKLLSFPRVLPEDPQKRSEIFLRDFNNATDIADFFDDFMTNELDEERIIGATVSVVKDGSVIFSESYGKLALGDSKSVDPETTRFRLASVSKSITATAIMQLVEAGRLELDLDINSYLGEDEKYRKQFEDVITVGDLLTHTAGIDEKLVYCLAESEESIIPLKKMIQDHMPKQIWPPRTVVSYSNHGYNLLGYLIEKVTNQSYEEYVKENIFLPLDMLHSTMNELEVSADDTAKEYLTTSVAAPRYFNNIVPAGGLLSTGHDMAQFMMCQLNLGALPNGTRILSEASALRMQSANYRSNPKLPGLGYGLYHYNLHNQSLVLHDGDLLGTSTRMVFMPEQSFGFFVTFNVKSDLRERILQQFLNEFFPFDYSPPPRKDSDRPERIDGVWKTTRSSHTDYTKFISLFLGQIPMTYQDGYVDVVDLRFEDSGDLVFYYDPSSNSNVTFEMNEMAVGVKDDKIKYVFFGHPAITFERSTIGDNIVFLLVMVTLLLLAICAPSCCWCCACCCWFSKSKKHEYEDISDKKGPGILSKIFSDKRTRYMGMAVVALLVFFNGTFVWLFPLMTLLSGPLFFPPSGFMRFLLIFPIFSCVVSILGIFLVVYIWVRRFWFTLERVLFSVIVISSFFFIPWYTNLNLLGYHY